MKKLILNFFIFALFFLLVSCGEGDREFTVWIGGSPQEVDFWEKTIEKFDSVTGYQTRLVRQPTYSDQRRQSLIVSLEAEQKNPDVFLMDAVWIDQFVKSGWLEKLDGYIQSANFPIENFFQRILELSDIYNGSYYALPVFSDVALLYYRKDLLKKYGFEDNPETWNELKNISQKIMREEDSEMNGFVWQGAQYEGMVCVFLEFIASNNGGFFDNGKLKLDQKANIDALKFMRNLIHAYGVSPLNTFTEMREEEARRTFQRGNAIFERNWTYAYKLHNSNDSKVKGKTAIASLPKFDDGISVSTLGGWHIGLSKYSDYKDIAWKFIQFVVSYKIQKEMALQIGWNPALKAIYEDPEIKKKLPHFQLLKGVFQKTVVRPNLPYYAKLSEIIQRNVNSCIAGKESAEAALKKAQDEASKLKEIYAK